MQISLNENGSLKALSLKENFAVPFRSDCYTGPLFYERMNGNDVMIPLKKKSDRYFEKEHNGCLWSLLYETQEWDETAILKLTAKITCIAENTYKPQMAGIQLGIDCYMDSYPQWNQQMFPTMFRCEKTHFWGYMMSPDGMILGLASPDPVACWNLEYHRRLHEGVLLSGHRIFTPRLQMLHEGPLPERHPQAMNLLEEGQECVMRLYLFPVSEETEVAKLAARFAEAPWIEAEQYTVSMDDKIVIRTNGDVEVLDPDGMLCKVSNDNENEYIWKAEKYGVYTVIANKNGRCSETKIYVRKKWSFYLDRARETLKQVQQKPSTHAETWYGFFTAFAAAKHLPKDDIDMRLREDFDKLFQMMYEKDENGLWKPKENTMPGRIQNTSSMISLLTDAYETFGEITYLEKASELADWLMKCQAEDGSYRSGTGQMYTCVIYLAKSMLELWIAEKKLQESDWRDRAKRHFESASTAIEYLAIHLDDIDTEGDLTFEDGMVSCSALQLAYLATLVPERKEHLLKASLYMINKHRCLEQNVIPDCRMRGATLRFWEARYDVIANHNMISSPHGWTAWKVYATYYLYMLTGEYEWLKATMDTLGACIQSLDVETENLRWGFVVDPYIQVDLWKPDLDKPGFAKLVPSVVGEQYLDMISDWWRVDEGVVVFGFADPLRNRIDGIYHGACCDNDVHEHFKCLEEVTISKCFVHEKAGEYICYNCKCHLDKEELIVIPQEDVVKEAVVHLDKSQKVRVLFEKGSRESNAQKGFTII